MDRSIIDGIDAARERLRLLVERLSDDDLSRSLGDGWTVAAALAHLAFWDRRAALLIGRWECTGVSPAPCDIDVINDAMLAQWRALPPRAAANDALGAAGEADRKVANLSADLAAAIKTGADIALDRSRHRTAHLDEIEHLFS